MNGLTLNHISWTGTDLSELPEIRWPTSLQVLPRAAHLRVFLIAHIGGSPISNFQPDHH